MIAMLQCCCVRLDRCNRSRTSHGAPLRHAPLRHDGTMVEPSRPHALSTAGDARMRVELEVPSKEGQHDLGNLRQRPMNRIQAAPSDACSEWRAFSVTGARAGGQCSQGSGMDWRGVGTDRMGPVQDSTCNKRRATTHRTRGSANALESLATWATPVSSNAHCIRHNIRHATLKRTPRSMCMAAAAGTAGLVQHATCNVRSATVNAKPMRHCDWRRTAAIPRLRPTAQSART